MKVRLHVALLPALFCLAVVPATVSVERTVAKLAPCVVRFVSNRRRLNRFCLVGLRHCVGQCFCAIEEVRRPGSSPAACATRHLARTKRVHTSTLQQDHVVEALCPANTRVLHDMVHGGKLKLSHLDCLAGPVISGLHRRPAGGGHVGQHVATPGAIREW